LQPSPRNPYAPPQASLIERTPTACTRDGKFLVVPQGHDLPGRCVKCNEPAALDKPRRFAWHHPAWYLFIPLNIIVYAVIATLVQKKARVAIGLCDAHRARRRHFYVAAWAILAIGLGLICSVTSMESRTLFAAVGAGLLLLACIVGIVGARVVWPARITREQTRLKGCGQAFLDSLPVHQAR
jgi:hypothetical protein